ncbi:transglutaminase-like domain-containing protein [Flavobacteriales bacterium]|nr:transglutaminase-like domain-containing protein [Flavobacteriales bacterium]
MKTDIEEIIIFILVLVLIGGLGYYAINSENTINEIGADQPNTAPADQSNIDSIFRLSENQVDKILSDHNNSTLYYGLYQTSSDAKIGYLSITKDIDTITTNEIYYTEQHEMKMFTNEEGNLDSTVYEWEIIFNTLPPYELLIEEENAIQYGDTMSMVTNPINDKYITAASMGSEIMSIDTTDRKISNYGLRDYFISQHIVSELNLGISNFAANKGFHLTEGKESTVDYSLSNTKDYFIEGGNVRCYTLELIYSKNDMFIEITYNQYGKEVSVEIMNVMEARLETKSQAIDIDKSGELLSIGTIKMILTKPEINYDTTKAVSALVYEIHGEYNDLFVEDNYQEVFEENGKKYIKSHNFNTHISFSEFEIDSLLSYSDPKYPINNSEIIDFANSAVNLDQSDSMKINDLLDFVYNYIDYSFEKKWHTSVYQIIESKKGVCSDKAYLFNVLSRTLGIPCKEVSGMAFIPEPDNNFWGAHAWNEVLINNKWYSIDPTWNQWRPRVSTSASIMGHLKMQENKSPYADFSLSLSSIFLEDGTEVNFGLGN